MSHTKNVITAPITMPSDVAAVLSIAGTDLGDICTSLAINKWAKYKPVKYAKIARLNDDTTESERAAANYGIEYIPTWSLIGKMLNFWLQQYDVSQNAPDCGIKSEYWHYRMPDGGLSSPYRLTDFVKSTTVGYYHDAHAPIGGLRYLTAEISPAGQLSIIYDNDTEQSVMSLKLTDLRYDGGGQISLSGFYFGVALVRESGASSSSAKRYVMTDVNASDAIEYGSHIYPWFLDSAAVTDFMGGNSDTTRFYSMSFLSNDEIYATITKAGSTLKTFLSSFSGVTANKFVALWERQVITINRIYAEGTVSALSAYRDPQDTRKLYYIFTLTNTSYQQTLTMKYTLTIYKSDGVTVIDTRVVTGISLPYGSSNAVTINTSIDLAQISGGLANAYYVRVISEVTSSGGYGIVSQRSSSEQCTVTDGPSPY